MLGSWVSENAQKIDVLLDECLPSQVIWVRQSQSAKLEGLFPATNSRGVAVGLSSVAPRAHGCETAPWILLRDPGRTSIRLVAVRRRVYRDLIGAPLPSETARYRRV
jgi:hypothetical protein